MNRTVASVTTLLRQGRFAKERDSAIADVISRAFAPGAS